VMPFFPPFNILFFSMLMPNATGPPHHEYTIRPWVKTGHPAMPILANASNIVAPAITTPATATIRVVDGSLDTGSIYSSQGIEPRDEPVLQDRDTPTPTFTGRHSRAHKSLSFRGKDKGTPSRSRGMTEPADYKPHTPERQRMRDRDSDRDSVVSFTPSMSSKHLANWFSGLLGR